MTEPRQPTPHPDQNRTPVEPSAGESRRAAAKRWSFRGLAGLGGVAVLVLTAGLAMPNHIGLAGMGSAFDNESSFRSEHQTGAYSSDFADSPGPGGEQAEEPRRVLVVLVDGRRFEGELISRSSELVVLRIDGVRSAFPTESVASVRDAPSIRDRYAALRRGVGDDPDQIVELAEWLRANGELGLALLEIERALSISPQHGPSLRLYAIIEQNIILRARQVDRNAPRAPAFNDDDDARHPQGFPLLNDSKVNLIRVYEMDFANPGRILIDRRTVDEFIAEYRNHPLLPATAEGREALRRAAPVNILRLMFRVQAREYYARVRVLDDPPALRIFRDEVNSGWLVNSCATNQCHGGAEAGRLQLANRSKRSAAVAYTNFLILERFRMDDGRPLIDHNAPERSPLLHLGLPRKDSMVPHPPVIRGRLGRDVWQPVFRSNRDRSYRRAIAWISALYRPRPEYPIDYTPPASLVPFHDDDDDDTGSMPASRRDRGEPRPFEEPREPARPGGEGRRPSTDGSSSDPEPNKPQPQPR